jgi:hypothetical protein
MNVDIERAVAGHQRKLQRVSSPAHAACTTLKINNTSTHCF